jgi:hypothetical protein
MEAPKYDSGLTVHKVEERVREASQVDASNVPVHEWMSFWVTLDQIQAGLDCLSESPRDFRATLPIPTLYVGKIRFGLRGETSVHSSRSSLARTSSHVLRRGRCLA